MKSPVTKLEKLTDNPFQNLYHAAYLDRQGAPRDYYFCSHNDEVHLELHTKATIPEGVMIYALTEEEHPRLVMIREYRVPIGHEIYSCPAGRIDPGENEHEAAIREMMEETGFQFTEYTGGDPSWRKPVFLVPGVSDEPNCTLYGTVKIPEELKQDDVRGEKTVSGEDREDHFTEKSESTEWIQMKLVDRTEARRILHEEPLDVRATFLLMQYLNSREEEPFGFLN